MNTNVAVLCPTSMFFLLFLDFQIISRLFILHNCNCLRNVTCAASELNTGIARLYRCTIPVFNRNRARDENPD